MIVNLKRCFDRSRRLISGRTSKLSCGSRPNEPAATVDWSTVAAPKERAPPKGVDAGSVLGVDGAGEDPEICWTGPPKENDADAPKPVEAGTVDCAGTADPKADDVDAPKPIGPVTVDCAGTVGPKADDDAGAAKAEISGCD